MKPFLSVIIPVYKVEAYLERCVHSVLNQDFTDIEVILVDDGSPDRCPDICDELSRNDERVVVIHKENGGLSSARNAGIKAASGYYLAFLDSDDQWAEGKLKSLMSMVEHNTFDMLVFDCVDLYPNRDFRKRDNGDLFNQEFILLDTKDYYKKIMGVGNFMESACTKIISKSFLVTNSLFFTPGITAEDSEWMIRLLRCANRIAISNVELFICTCLREGSIQNSIREKNICDLIGIIDRSIDYYHSNPNGSFKQYEFEQCAYLLANATGLLVYITDKQEKGSLKHLLKQKSWLFKYANNRKTKLSKIVNDIFGFDFLVYLLQLYMILLKKNIVNKKKTITFK